MATRTIRLEFAAFPDENQVIQWNHTYEVPIETLQPSANQALQFEILKAMKDTHRAKCTLKCSGVFYACNALSTGCSINPSHRLDPADPHARICVVPVCSSPKCKETIVQRLLDSCRTEARPSRSSGDACVVFGKGDGLFQCSKRRNVTYCGREHQRVDWKAHNTMCQFRE